MPVILSEEGPHNPEGDEILREELFHRATFLAGGAAIRLSRRSLNRLVLDPAGRKIARHLLAGHAGVNYKLHELDDELPAHAARGPLFWAQVGITREQAREVLDLYFALVEREHGKEAVETLRRWAPRINDETEDLQHGDSLPEAGGDAGREETGSATQREGKRGHEEDTGETGIKHARGGTPVRTTAEVVAELRDDFRATFNPAARDESALQAALSLREWGARAARDYDQAKNELKAARACFRGKSLEEALDFIDHIEEDRTTDLPPETRAYAETMRRLLDDRRNAVQALGTGKLTT